MHAGQVKDIIARKKEVVKLKIMIRHILQLWQYRELISNLTMREIKQRYKQSVLGYFWVILNPLFQMIVMTFVFSTVMRVTIPGIPYAMFLYCALLPWNLLSNTILSSTSSLIDHSNLIRQIYFPREILILATMLAKVIDFALASVVFILLMIFFQIKINFNILWFFPLFTIQFIFTFGVSLITASFNLFYRDIQYLMNLILLLWFYLTPVIYPKEILPDQYRFIFKLNFMSVMVNAYRQVILGHGMPKLSSVAIAASLALVTLITGYHIFKKLEGSFADNV